MICSGGRRVRPGTRRPGRRRRRRAEGDRAEQLQVPGIPNSAGAGRPRRGTRRRTARRARLPRRRAAAPSRPSTRRSSSRAPATPRPGPELADAGLVGFGVAGDIGGRIGQGDGDHGGVEQLRPTEPARRSDGSVMSQNRAVSAPSRTTTCQPWALPALGPATRGRRGRRPRPRPGARAGTPGSCAGRGRRRVGASASRRGGRAAPSLTRSSAIVQPYTTNAPPSLGTRWNSATGPRRAPRAWLSWSMKPLLTVDLDHEGLLVVLASPSKRLASRRPHARSSPTARTPGRGVTSSRSLKASSGVGRDEARADHHVLVGEGHQGPVVGLLHQRPQHLVTLGGALHAQQADAAHTACRRCARAWRS